MEFNKIFAAVLVAGILAMLAGFIAKTVVDVKAPTEFAFSIEAVDDTPGGAVVEAKVEPILALLASANVEKGASLARACAACHTFDKGGANRVGPNIWNIVGSKHAHISGFAYSDGMKKLADKNWTYQGLNEFLWNPKKAVPGTKMVFAGLKKPQDRADVIAWLRSLSDAPKALPSQNEIDAELQPANEVAPEAVIEGTIQLTN